MCKNVRNIELKTMKQNYFIVTVYGINSWNDNFRFISKTDSCKNTFRVVVLVPIHEK